MKRLFTLLLSLFIMGNVMAQKEVTQDNVMYTLFTPEGAVPYAAVTGYSAAIGTNLIIPPLVEYEGVRYPVTTIENQAFQGNTTLISVVLSAPIAVIGENAFANCTTLTILDLPETITAIGKNAFADCPTLAEVCYKTASPITTSSDIFSPTTYEYAELYVNEGGVEKAKSTVPWSLFSTIREKDFTIGQILRQDGLIYSLAVNSNGQSYASVMGNYLSQPTNLVIPETVVYEEQVYPVTTIGRGAFMSCQFLVSLTVPDSVDEIENWAFIDCHLLSQVTLPYMLQSINMGTFANCASLKELSLPKAVTSIGTGAFTACVGLTSLEWPTELLTIGKGAFGVCTALTSLSLPDQLTNIGGAAFSGCIGLTSIDLPGSIKGIGQTAFIECTSLKEIIYRTTTPITASQTIFSPETYQSATLKVNLGGLEAAKTTVPWNLFTTVKDGSEDMPKEPVETTIDNLVYTISFPDDIPPYATVKSHGQNLPTDLVIPDSITYTGVSYPVKEIEEYALQNLQNVQSIAISEGIERIGKHAIYNCYELRSIQIPASINAIGSSAFSCYEPQNAKLQKVFYNSSNLIEAASDIFSSNTYTTTALFLPVGSLEQAEVKSPWKEFYKTFEIDFSNTDFVLIDGLDFILYNQENGTPHAVLFGNSLTNDTDLIIPESVNVDSNEYPVTEIGPNAFYNCTYLKSVSVPACVAKVGTGAFQSCDNLTAVSLPEGLKEIGQNTFSGCRSLAEIAIPQSVTQIGAYAFHVCSSLKTLTIPDNVTAIGAYAFRNCRALNQLKFGTSLNEIGEYAFYYCEGLKELEISESVISIGEYAFSYCNYLEKMSLPGTVTEIGRGAFLANQYMNNLREVYYDTTKPVAAESDLFNSHAYSDATLFVAQGGLDNAKETTPWASFSDIRELDFANATPVTVDSLRYMLISDDSTEPHAVLFGNRITVDTDLVVPESVNVDGTDYPVTQIGPRAFYDCTYLKSVSVPTCVAKVGAGAFQGCRNLALASLPDGITEIEPNTFNGCSALSDMAIPETVSSIGDHAFNGCSSLCSLRIPDAVKNIGAGAFTNCSNLAELSLGASLEAIGESAFYDCSNLKEVAIPDGVLSIGDYAFSWCNHLEKLSLPGTVTEIGRGAFLANQYMNNLREVYYDTTKPVAAESDLFNSNAYSNATLFVAQGGLDNAKETTPWASFSDIRELDFGKGTRMQLDGVEYTLYAVTDGVPYASVTGNTLTEPTDLTIPASVNFEGTDYIVTYVGNIAFENCETLVSLNIPNSVKSIGQNAFYGCGEMVSVVIPAEVTSIAQGAFANCKSLTEVYYRTKEPIYANSNVFSETTYQMATLYVADGGIEKAKSTSPWQSFRNIRNESGSLPGEPYELMVDHIYYMLYTTEDDNRYAVIIANDLNTLGTTEKIDLVIPTSVSDRDKEYPVTEIGPDAFAYCNALASVVIPESVSVISRSAFYSCTDLTTVIIPAEVEEIGTNAFYGCYSIDNVTYASLSPIEAEDNIFSDNVYDNATLYVNAEAMERIRETQPWKLFNTINDKPVEIEPFDVTVDGVTYTLYTPLDDNPYAVVSGTDLRESGAEATIINLNIQSSLSYDKRTYPVKEIGKYALYKFDNLQSVVIPNSVNVIKDGAFYGTPHLTEVTIPNSVSEIGEEAFYYSGLTSVNIPTSLESLGDRAFGDCPDLMDVYYWTTDPINANENVFDSGTYEKATLHIAVNGIDNAKATAPWNLFHKIIDQNGYDPDAPIEATVITVDNVTYTLSLLDEEPYATVTGNTLTGNTKLTLPESVEYGNIAYPVTAVADSAFFGCNALSALVLPNSMVSISTKAFANCENLTFVDFPASITTIGNEAFANVPALAEIYYRSTNPTLAPIDVFSFETYENAQLYVAIGGMEYVKITTPWNLFQKVYEKDFTVGNIIQRDGLIYSLFTDTNGYRYASVTANYLSEITMVEIPESIMNEGESYTVTTIGRGAFQMSPYLAAVNIPNTVTEIDSWAFADCRLLSGVSFGYSVKSIGIGAFSACVSLENVFLPSSLQSIGQGAFTGCISMNLLSIPENVTTIGGAAFSGCVGVTILNLYASLTSIGKGAFFGCTNLIEVHYDTNQPISAGMETFSPETYAKAILFVAYGGIDNARATTPWNLFTNIQEEGVSGIDDLLNDFDRDMPIEIYDFNGRKISDSVNGLTKGQYIVRQGNKVKKINIR